jgi:hypothetical protein
VADLKVDGDAVEFFLPTFVAPRYTPASESDPVPKGGPAPPDGLRFELVAAMASDIIAIESKVGTVCNTNDLLLSSCKHLCVET